MKPSFGSVIFLELFCGSQKVVPRSFPLLTKDLFGDTAAILNHMIPNSYYEMFGGNLFIWSNSIHNGRCIAKIVLSCSYLACYHHLVVSDIVILLAVLI